MPAYKIAQMGLARTYQNIKIFGSLTVQENLMVGAMLNYNKGGILRLFTHFRESNRMEREMKEMAEQTAERIGMAHALKEEARNLPYCIPDGTDV